MIGINTIIIDQNHGRPRKISDDSGNCFFVQITNRSRLNGVKIIWFNESSTSLVQFDNETCLFEDCLNEHVPAAVMFLV